jgi:recombinational DNA repair ATPase RecF
MLNEQKISIANNYSKYDKIQKQINVLFESLENCEFLDQKDLDIIETKLNQIKSKVLKKV